ncbi:MAG TPA: hypothetical protein PKA33_13740 [Amaricoccus sp.]|jgi:hypothetical protein|uniref:hypothetical protein n=1 Tax=Amaricoccus sp. TaxID=1872485 RepID=UPI002B95D32D|nr:hypothetical protein [Amaricoccus sp.]HMQ94420.1 hypothetical protein [Amaricoccus sp.]HMR36551.1 hypothetical protein [Paracoccus sp. (in: a-proteobacteria)]HMR53458.1 hypothetical protein [Amaricoccus sp.]HMU00415.1 hypothetical protein [Amaricoccus sp.]
MIAQPVTSPLSCRAPARTTREGGRAASGRARALFRVRRDWLRHLSLGLLLFALSAFLLQSVAHASPGGHAVHHDAAVAVMAQPCADSHASGEDVETSVEHCESGKAGSGLLDCCQACLVAAILPETQSLSPNVSSDHPSRMRPDRLGRIPAGILKPPRLITAA